MPKKAGRASASTYHVKGPVLTWKSLRSGDWNAFLGLVTTVTLFSFFYYQYAVVEWYRTEPLAWYALWNVRYPFFLRLALIVGVPTFCAGTYLMVWSCYCRTYNDFGGAGMAALWLWGASAISLTVGLVSSLILWWLRGYVINPPLKQ